MTRLLTFLLLLLAPSLALLLTASPSSSQTHEALPLSDPPILEHGQGVPTWNDPTVQDVCFTGTGEHDTWVGDEWVMPTPYAPTTRYVYGFDNANSSQPFLATDDCGRNDNYTNAGQLGYTVSHITRVFLGHLDADPMAQGLVFWSAGWQSPVYTPYGWTMLDTSGIYEVWVVDDTGLLRFDGAGAPLPPSPAVLSATPVFDVAGQKVGWRVAYVLPTDPALVGVSLYRQSGIDFDGGYDPAGVNFGVELGGVWRKTLTDF